MIEILEVTKIGFQELAKLPSDLVQALSYGLMVLKVRENLPKEYLPKSWKWLFDDEISKCIEKYRKSLKSDSKTSSTQEEEPEISNPLADAIAKKLKGEID